MSKLDTNGSKRKPWHYIPESRPSSNDSPLCHALRKLRDSLEDEWNDDDGDRISVVVHAPPPPLPAPSKPSMGPLGPLPKGLRGERWALLAALLTALATLIRLVFWGGE